MLDYTRLFSLLNPLSANGTVTQDDWGSLTISGDHYAKAAMDISTLSSYLADVSIRLAIKFDGKDIKAEDIDAYVSGQSFVKWEIHINKLKSLYVDADCTWNFFYSISTFTQWVEKVDPLNLEAQTNRLTKLKIIVQDIQEHFIGCDLQIISAAANQLNIPFVVDSSLPDDRKVQDVVHVVGSGKIIISPKKYFLRGNFSSPLGIVLLRLCSIPYAAALVHFFESKQKVVIDGYKRTAIPLFNSTDAVDVNAYQTLIETVTWVYGDRTQTKLKLFCERLSLEIDESRSLLYGLTQHISSALEQAKKRYDFVILERKDKYVAELKDLLKDIRTQSDLYAIKIRTLLNNLLRDAIAAIILIGFTIFTKISDNVQLYKSDLIIWVFDGLALYYIISILVQCLVDLVDIRVTKNEIYYWKNATKEQLPTGEFQEHIKNSLRGRRRSLLLYVPIGLLYVLLAFACYKFPTVLANLANAQTEQNDSTNVHLDPKSNCSPNPK